MPTELDFMIAANSCRQTVESLSQLHRGFTAVEEYTGLDGTGSVLVRVVQGVRACTENVKSMIIDFDATADVLDTRARQAASYTDAVKAWRREHQAWVNLDAAHRESRMGPTPTTSPGPEPQRPARTPPYVDESRPGSLW